MNSMRGLLKHAGETVGSTPLVALDRLSAKLPARIAVKLEFFAPGASIKDRAAWAILEEAERLGQLRKGQPVIELTSGNMGAGLAWACAVKGYRFIAVMSKGNTPERRQMIKAFGAKLVLVPQAKGGRKGQVSREDLEKVESKTCELVQKHNAFRPDQFNNPASVVAHERGTGSEIWTQSGGLVTHFCSLVGTGGTLMGVSKALKKRSASVTTYAVEPAGARILGGKKVRSTQHKIQGGGYALIPAIYDAAMVDGTVPIKDDEAIRGARLLAEKEGIMGGFSSGANVAAALKLSRKARPGSLIVTVVCDTGLKYLSTELYPA